MSFKSVCIALATQSDGTAYALVWDLVQAKQIELLYINFSTKKYQKKTAEPISTYMIQDPWGFFIDNGPEFHASASFF